MPDLSSGYHPARSLGAEGAGPCPLGQTPDPPGGWFSWSHGETFSRSLIFPVQSADGILAAQLSLRGPCFSRTPAYRHPLHRVLLVATPSTPVQRVVHRHDDFVDADRAIAVRVTRRARRDAAVAQGDVRHRDQLVDGDLTVAIAVARAHRRQRTGRAHGWHL